MLSIRKLQNISTALPDEAIIALLVKRDSHAFEHVFKTHYKNLHSYVFTLLKDNIYAEEIVQQVFFKLWERADKISINGSVAAYLYRSVYNESLNHLKHQEVKSKYQLHMSHSQLYSIQQAHSSPDVKKLEQKIHAAVNELPEQCRTIFQKSRFEDKKYREIADELNIAVKTVENQMSKALKIIREKIGEFLILVFLFLTF